MPWSIEKLENVTGIDSEILEAVLILEKKIDDENITLTDEQVKSVQIMLASLISDMDTNKKFASISSKSKQDTGISLLNISTLKNVSYRTRHLDKITCELDRIWTDFQDVQERKKTLQENEKITLKQYGMLYDLAHLNKDMETFNKFRLIKGNKQLEKLYEQTQHAAAMVSYLDNTFNQNFQMPTGSVVFDNTQKKSEIYSKELNFFEKLIAFFITKFGHVSKGISVDKNGEVQNKLSHINPWYVEEEFTLRNYLYSDVYKIKIENLIDKATKELLDKHLGSDWLKQIEDMYAQLERQIHDGQRIRHFHIISEDGMERQAQIATALLQGGHKNLFMKDHSNKDVRDDILGRGRWAQGGGRETSNILCSEFIGKTIIATIQKLNDDIAQQLATQGVTDLPDPVIKNPVSEKEKLHLLTPERLLTAMQERGAVEKVATPIQLSQFVTKGDSENTSMNTLDIKTQMNKLRESKEPDLYSTHSLSSK